jgi:signal transduction histidine kinase
MDEPEAQLARMERILEISRELASTVSLEALLLKIVHAAVELTSSEAAAILLPVEDGCGNGDQDHGLRFAVATHPADRLAEIPVPIEGSIAGAALTRGEPVNVPNPHDDSRYYPVMEGVTGLEACSLLAVPLQFQERRIGVLEVQNKRDDDECRDSFDGTDVETLTVLAAHAAVAIENARLYDQVQGELTERQRAEEALRQHRDRLEELVRERTLALETLNQDLAREIVERRGAEEALQHYTERLRILNEIGQSILAARLPETIAVAAIRRIRQLIPCQRAMVIAIVDTAPTDASRIQIGQIQMLASESSGEIEKAAAGSLSADDPSVVIAVYGRMFEERPLSSGWISGAEDLATLSQYSPPQQALYDAGVRSYVSVPLFIQEELVGALTLESSQPRAFTPDHIDIAAEVAASLAVAIQQVRLYEQAQQEIAERMRAEAAQRRYTVELEERNAELDAFAHTVAHDLKNPVGSIIGYADVLAQEYAAMSEKMVRTFLRTISQNSRKVDAIIDNLLLLSSVRHAEEIETHPLDMGRIVAETRGRLLQLIEELQGEIVLPERWPVAVGYAPWVEEVWTNYIGNALKYGGRPPRLELGARIQEGAPSADGTPSSSIRFWVRDNGPGLSPAEQSRLFTPFERLHQAEVKGHGLGLSIVQRIVQRLGGKAGVESAGTPGEGSTFFFTLPAIADTADLD